MPCAFEKVGPAVSQELGGGVGRGTARKEQRRALPQQDGQHGRCRFLHTAQQGGLQGMAQQASAQGHVREALAIGFGVLAKQVMHAVARADHAIAAIALASRGRRCRYNSGLQRPGIEVADVMELAQQRHAQLRKTQPAQQRHRPATQRPRRMRRDRQGLEKAQGGHGPGRRSNQRRPPGNRCRRATIANELHYACKWRADSPMRDRNNRCTTYPVTEKQRPGKPGHRQWTVDKSLTENAPAACAMPCPAGWYRATGNARRRPR